MVMRGFDSGKRSRDPSAVWIFSSAMRERRDSTLPFRPAGFG
jgi:hypothetical protein